MARRYSRRGQYKFTARRRAALKRAQLKSARKRKLAIGISAGVAVGAAAYLGVRNRSTISRTASSWKNAVSPGSKERTRVASAVSVARPSTTKITANARARADTARQQLANSQIPKHLRGKDQIDSDAITGKQTANLVRKAKRNPGRLTKDNKIRTRTQQADYEAEYGKKISSYTGTPGGKKTPPKASKRGKAALHGGLTEEQWQAALGFDVLPKQPAVSRRSSSGGRDPLHSLYLMKLADEKLLGG